MDAIESRIVERSGQTFRVDLYHDPDAPNPLEDGDEMGMILSLNRRHRCFDPAGIEDAIESNPDVVPLSYFEHGLCRWSVADEGPARRLWDSVGFAGLWLPDDATLASARPYGGRTRRLFLRIRARQACDAFTRWCNGDIYGFEVLRVWACPECGVPQTETVDSGWGIDDLAACRRAATAAIALHVQNPF